MEALPFIFLIAIGAIFYAAIPLGYLFLVLSFRKYKIAQYGTLVNIVYLSIFILGPPLWLISGYLSFQRGCESSTGINYISSASNVKGIVVYPFPPIYSKGGSGPSAALSLLKNGTYQCIEYKIDDKVIRLSATYLLTADKGHIVQSLMPEENINSKKLICSEYAIKYTQPKPVNWLISPFHSTTDIVIFNRYTGDVLAQAREQLFGGGILSVYRNALDGGKSNEYAACGYLSDQPHKWRPQKSIEYREMDSQLILKTLKPIKNID
jgi:hypothetical protein